MPRTTLLVIALSFASFFAGLGRPAISDSDEAFYAEAGREMVAGGDWLTPHYNDEVRFQKPILFYWLIALTYAIAGVGEVSARFWSAASGLGLALVTAACARRWIDERAAWLAGAIVATSFGYFAMARLSLPDLPLAFFITVGTWAGFEAFDADIAARRRWLLLSAAAAALAVLTKGPVGVALPAMVIGAAWIAERRTRRIRARELALPLTVFVAIAVPWFAVMTARHGTSYLEGFLVGDNLERFATDRFNDPRPLWFYMPIVLGGMLPWSPFLLLWLRPVRQAVARMKTVLRAEKRLMLWAALPLLFFSISIGKQPRYILPVLPPLAILLAASIAGRLEEHERGARMTLVRACGVASGGLMIALALLLVRARPLLVFVPPGLAVASVSAVLLAGVLVGAVAAFRPRWAPAAVATGGVVTLLAIHYGALAPPRPDAVERMAALVVQHRQADEPVGSYQALVRNLIFYTGIRRTDLFDRQQLVAFLGRPERVLGVAADDELAAIERAGVQVRRLGRVRYFNTAAAKLGTLLWPDPPRDLDTVVLFTNR